MKPILTSGINEVYFMW